MSFIEIAAVRRVSVPAWALAVVLASAFAHLLVAGRVALSVDEAHYALYGLYPALSYFDHPPLVGWLQALALQLGSAEWVLRLWPVLLSLLAAALLYRLTRLLLPEGGRTLAALAVLLLHSAVMVQLLGVALVPELPLLVCALGALLALVRALRGGGVVAWLLVGVGFGLAGLAKYTAVLLVLSAAILLVSERRLALLRTPGPWLAALVAFAFIVPVLWWNQQHDWLSLRYQSGHGAPDRDWQMARFLRAQAGQLLAYGPLLFVGGIAGLIAGWRRRDRFGERVLLAGALPVLLLFGWASGYQETLPHWTLLAWALLAPLAARWLLDGWARRGVRLLTGGGAAYAVLLFVVVHTQLFRPWMPFSERSHPLGDLYGWQEVAERAAALAREQGAGQLFVEHWTHASRIAWYARPLPVKVIDRRTDQFDLWFDSPHPGDDGILVRWERAGRTPAPLPFAQCAPAQEVEPELNGVPVHRFVLYLCAGFRGGAR